MRRFPLASLAVGLTLAAVAAPDADAQSDKETDCARQAAVVAAVQKARLDRVPEDKVTETIVAGEPGWPERYNNAIPIFAAQIYQLKMRDVKRVDLSAEWMNTCMTN